MVVDYISKRVQKLRENCSGEQNSRDFLQVFIQKHIDDPETLTIEEIVHQFFTFYFAGTDTTGNLTGMMIYSLAKHPEIQKRLEEEIEANLEWSSFNLSDLKKLTYLEYFTQESLRYYPPAAAIVMRVAQ